MKLVLKLIAPTTIFALTNFSHADEPAIKTHSPVLIEMLNYPYAEKPACYQGSSSEPELSNSKHQSLTMNFFTRLKNSFEKRAKREALIQLRAMPERQLLDCGISPDLLALGLKGWPWRELPESASPIEYSQWPEPTSFSLETAEVDDTEKQTTPVQRERDAA